MAHEKAISAVYLFTVKTMSLGSAILKLLWKLYTLALNRHGFALGGSPQSGKGSYKKVQQKTPKCFTTMF